jgi:hypothetical protein
MLARAMFFVSIGNLARYLLNAFGTRHNLYNIFDDVGNAINDILEAGGVLNEEGHSCLRRRVLRRCPAWQEKLERWEQKTGNREMGRSVYLEINTDHNRAWVASHWAASLPDLLATLERNLDKNCEGIDVLQDAPVNTDIVEGNMGLVDYMRHKSQAHLENTFGMAHANRTRVFSTAEQSIDITTQRQKKKKKSDWVEIEDTHTMTRWRDLPRDQRLRIMRVISKKAKLIRARKRAAVKSQQVTIYAWMHLSHQCLQTNL